MKVFSTAILSYYSLFVVATKSFAEASTNSKNTGASFSGALRKRGGEGHDSNHQDEDEDDQGDSYYLSAIVTLDPVIPPKGNKDGWNRDLVTDALIKADAIINTKSKYHAQSGFIAKYVDIPEGGDFCDDNDDGPDDLTLTATRYYGNLYWHNINYGCGMGCGWDDDSFLKEENKRMSPLDLFVEVSNGRTPMHHRALEFQLCALLRESGEPALANVETCNIDYIYNGDEDFMRHGSMIKNGGRAFGPSFAKTPVETNEDKSLAVEKQ
ncbi:hypothetical protein ACA910_006598 [Epithemia clementina (nom. ined.)]